MSNSAPSIPATMRAIQCSGTSQLTEATLPVPQPGPKEVLIKVAASGVNPVDYKVLQGGVPLGKPHPFTGGCDAAGTVVAIGPEVTEFKVGDEVMGMTGGLGNGPQGTLAEYAISWETMLAKKPANITMRQAAAAPLALMTAWEGMADRNKIKPTDHVLVTGASGSVGQACLQIAKAAGAARVYGLASEAKRDLVERYGAVFIDYKKGLDALRTVCKEQTPDGAGFDVLYESVGGEMLDVMFELVAPHGFVATINAFEPHHLAPAALKGIGMCFPLTCLPFMYPTDKNAVYMGGLLRECMPLLAAGKLDVMVDEELKCPFTVDGVLKAYSALEKCENKGKIVIDIAPVA